MAIKIADRESMTQTAAEVLFIAVLFTVATLLLASCATSPTGRKQLLAMPEEQMQQMGVQAFDQMKAQTPVQSDAATNTYVKCIVNALIPAITEGEKPSSWEVVVFKDDTANAFALPGGKIGVHTGLLKVATTPDQVAAVVGHEIGHVLARHGNERVTQQFGAQLTLGAASALLGSRGGKSDLLMAALGAGAQYGVLLPFSRKQESEADEIGLDLMARAGFDPQQSVTLWENMGKAGGGQPPEFLSTHPSHESRIQDLKARMSTAMSEYGKSGKKPNCRL